jgi:hypothetical protein
MCIAEARQGTRTLRLSLERDGRWSRGSLHWSDGEPPIPTLLGPAPGGC